MSQEGWFTTGLFPSFVVIIWFTMGLSLEGALTNSVVNHIRSYAVVHHEVIMANHVVMMNEVSSDAGLQLETCGPPRGWSITRSGCHAFAEQCQCQMHACLEARPHSTHPNETAGMAVLPKLPVRRPGEDDAAVRGLPEAVGPLLRVQGPRPEREPFQNAAGLTASRAHGLTVTYHAMPCHVLQCATRHDKT